MGKVYTKLRYVAYTDGSFTKRAERPDKWRHLGLLGPTLEAKVRGRVRVRVVVRVTSRGRVRGRGRVSVRVRVRVRVTVRVMVRVRFTVRVMAAPGTARTHIRGQG